MTQSLITVVLFVVLLCAMPFALRRLQARRGITGGMVAGTASKLLSTVAVGPQQRVVTVEVGPHGARTWLVLGVTGQSINCLHVLPATPAEGAIDV
ncbi:flagellar biosynthetic protein FliO [Variovorax sp. J22P168]|uniref:FliO/MopB family protein n=1 Tax=Variovorax jilinensis TaxID=3053513 RepID=UPI0025770935|nr:flagellar biosynthetic protein FliO [Variovorax sp. J22P168]MDM0014776.1 flagellar biosynthetic protein FliO [Variovorax sp. J22P168]